LWGVAKPHPKQTKAQTRAFLFSSKQLKMADDVAAVSVMMLYAL
jgi:hypothetical protein